MGQAAWCLGESSAGVADGDGREFYLSPNLFEGGDERGVLGGLLLKLLAAIQGRVTTDLD